MKSLILFIKRHFKSRRYLLFILLFSLIIYKPVFADQGSIDNGSSVSDTGQIDNGSSVSDTGQIDNGSSVSDQGPIATPGSYGYDMGETPPSPSPTVGSYGYDTGETSPTIAPSCPVVAITYGQCGGTTGLENYPSDHNIQVTKYVYSCNGNIAQPYVNQDQGRVPGLCGVPSSQPVQDCGSYQYKYPECDWNSHQVYQVWQNSCGNYQRINYQYQDGSCGYTASQTSQQPSIQQSSPVNVTVCTGETMTEDRMNQLLQGAGYGGPWDINSAKAAYNRAACPVSTPTQTPLPTPTPVIVYVTPTPTPTEVPVPTATPMLTPTPAPIGGANSMVSCPAGTSQYLSGSTVICMSQSANAQTGPITVTNTNNNNNVVNPAAPVVVNQSQPQVVYVSGATGVTTLPKTGMPVEAWGLTGFFPAGLWLKKFASSKKVLQGSANYLWHQRQFLKK